MNTSLLAHENKNNLIELHVLGDTFPPTEVGRIFARTIESHARSKFRESWESVAMLDVGCGSGNTTAHLARACPNATVFATDINPNAVWSTQNTAMANGFGNVKAILADKELGLLQGTKLEKLNLVSANLPQRWTPKGDIESGGLYGTELLCTFLAECQQKLSSGCEVHFTSNEYSNQIPVMQQCAEFGEFKRVNSFSYDISHIIGSSDLEAYYWYHHLRDTHQINFVTCDDEHHSLVHINKAIIK